MGVLKKMVLLFMVILITSVLWVGMSLYLSYTETQLRGEILGSENVYEFLSKGMLDEVKITVEEDESLPTDDISVDLLEPIEPYFPKTAFEKVMEKVEELIVSPAEFHQLQNEAVMRRVEVGEGENELQDESL